MSNIIICISGTYRVNRGTSENKDILNLVGKGWSFEIADDIRERGTHHVWSWWELRAVGEMN